MSGTTCCVPGCNSNSKMNKNVSYHRFPRDRDLCKDWVQRINRPGKPGRYRVWRPTIHNRICGLHFNTSGRRQYMDKVPIYFPSGTINKTSLPEKNLIYIFPELSLGAETEIPCKPHMSIAGYSYNISLVRCADSSEKAVPAALVDHQYQIQYDPRAEVRRLQEITDLLYEENVRLREEVKSLKVQLQCEKKSVKELAASNILIKHQQTFDKEKLCEFRIENLMRKKNVGLLRFYTGFHSAEKFTSFASFVKLGYDSARQKNKKNIGRPLVLSYENQLLLFLCRLRIGLLEEDLAYRFKVSITTVSNAYSFWFEFLSSYLELVPILEGRKVENEHMSDSFNEPNTSEKELEMPKKMSVEMGCGTLDENNEDRLGNFLEAKITCVGIEKLCNRVVTEQEKGRKVGAKVEGKRTVSDLGKIGFIQRTIKDWNAIG